jgi:hypothetical protein
MGLKGATSMSENIRRRIDTTEPNHDNLDPHPLAATMPMIEGKDRENVKADIAKQGVLVKIVLFNGNADGTAGAWRILDGRNRYGIARELGLKLTADNFDAFKGSYAEAEAYVISTNLQRRQLTNAQKQEVVWKMIQKYPDASDRQIARICSLTAHSFVGTVRDRMTNTPEKKEFDAFKKNWDKLSEEKRVEFVKLFAADIREYLAA